MVDLTITPGNVVAGSDMTKDFGTCGETITAGQAVYKDLTTRKWMRADNNAGTFPPRTAAGIALNGGSLNQPITVGLKGDITIGAALTAGTAYYLSDSPGGICPLADLAVGEGVCLIGLAKNTTVLAVQIQTPGVTL